MVDIDAISTRRERYIEDTRSRLEAIKGDRRLTMKGGFKPKTKLAARDWGFQLERAAELALSEAALEAYLTYLFVYQHKAGIYWLEGRGPRATPRGELSIHTMVVPLLTKETRTWHEATPADEIEQRRSLRVFSDHRNAGDMVLSFLRLTGDGQLEIVWQDDQGSLHDLDADLHEYFRAAADLVGWFGWQSLYADVRLSDDRWRTCRESLETLFEEGPRLLPPFDVDRYRARFAARL